MKKILPLLFTAIFFVLVVNAQWHSNGPYGAAVQSLASNGSVMVAGVWDDGIFISTDSGQHWVARDSGIQGAHGFAVAIHDSSIFAATSWGLLVSSINDRNWTVLNSHLSAYTFLFTDSTIFIGTSGGVYKSTNDGSTWVLSNTGLPVNNFAVNAMAVAGSNIFAATDSRGVFLSTDHGASWKAVNTGLSDTMVSSILIDGSNIFVGTYNPSTTNHVFLSTNNGTSWAPVSSGLQVGQLQVKSLIKTGAGIFAGTENNGVYFSANNGGSWAPVNTGVSTTSIRSFALMGTNLYCGSADGIFKTSNNGNNWTATNTGLTATYTYSLAVKGMQIFTGTSRGVFISSDGGNSWVKSTSGLPVTRAVVCFAVKDTNIYAGVDTGIFVYNNSGAYWQPLPNNGLPPVDDFRFVSSLIFKADSFYAGTGHGVYLSTDYGNNWVAVNQGLKDTSVTALALSGNTIFAATTGGIFKSANNGTNWMEADSGTSPAKYFISLGTNDANIFAGTPGYAFLSTNNGASWTSLVNNGTANADLKGFAFSGGNTFGASNSGQGVLVSPDNGLSWAPQNSGFTNWNFEALAISGSYIFVASNGGGVWQRPLSEFNCAPPVAPVNTTALAAQTICIGNSAMLSATGTGTLGWYSAASGGTYLGGGGIFTTPTLNSTTSFYVQDSTCGASVRTAVTVTVISALTPTVTITSNEATIICSGSIVAFTAAVTNAGTAPAYNWKLNGTTVQSGPVANYTKLITTGTSRLGNQLTVSCVLTSNAACLTTPTATSNTIRDTILNLPVRTTVSGQSKGVCGSSTWAYHCIAVPGAVSYTWHVPLNAVINSGQGTTDVTITFPANFDSGTVAVVGRNRCGNGTISSLTVKCSTRSGDDTETGVEEIPADETISWNVYPNPSGGLLYIDLIQTQPAQVTYKVFNLLGEIVYQYTSTEPVDYYHEQLNLSTQPAGMYFIQVRTGEAVLSKNIIVATK